MYDSPGEVPQYIIAFHTSLENLLRALFLEYICVLNCIFSAPSPPESVKVNAINSTAIHVKWKPPRYPNGPLKLYTVLYDRTQHFVTSNARKESVMPNVTQVFIGGLAPFTNYTVKVKVENTLTGKESKAVTVVTKATGNDDE